MAPTPPLVAHWHGVVKGATRTRLTLEFVVQGVVHFGPFPNPAVEYFGILYDTTTEGEGPPPETEGRKPLGLKRPTRDSCENPARALRTAGAATLLLLPPTATTTTTTTTTHTPQATPTAPQPDTPVRDPMHSDTAPAARAQTPHNKPSVAPASTLPKHTPTPHTAATPTAVHKLVPPEVIELEDPPDIAVTRVAPAPASTTTATHTKTPQIFPSPVAPASTLPMPPSPQVTTEDAVAQAGANLDAEPDDARHSHPPTPPGAATAARTQQPHNNPPVAPATDFRPHTPTTYTAAQTSATTVAEEGADGVNNLDDNDDPHYGHETQQKADDEDDEKMMTLLFGTTRPTTTTTTTTTTIKKEPVDAEESRRMCYTRAPPSTTTGVKNVAAPTATATKKTPKPKGPKAASPHSHIKTEAASPRRRTRRAAGVKLEAELANTEVKEIECVLSPTAIPSLPRYLHPRQQAAFARIVARLIDG